LPLPSPSSLRRRGARRAQLRCRIRSAPTSSAASPPATGRLARTSAARSRSDVSDRIAVEARALHITSGAGESGFQMTGALLLTLARTDRAEAYVAAGGGISRASFDMDDEHMFGGMNGQYSVGMSFAAMPGMSGFVMTNGTTYTASRMPAYYANRLGTMTVMPSGQWGMRTFTDPAMVIGGGLKLNLTERLYVTPDVRGIIAFSGGHHAASMTMNLGFGVRF
jgi:hypothetical protein